MDVFLARQPIFNRRLQVVAYEILYRNSYTNEFDVSVGGEEATLAVISDLLVHFGVETILRGKRAFINFPKTLLQENLPAVFKTDEVVIELLENVDPDAELIERCRVLKEQGYAIALDDFSGDPRLDDLMPYVDVIKVDFKLTSPDVRRDILKKYSVFEVSFLAEKIETHAEYQEAVGMGFRYFQGFFFERPVVCKEKALEISFAHYLDLLQELNSEEPDFLRLAEIIKMDYGLTYKLLRLINSAAFYKVEPIHSVNHALTLLGLNEIRRWIMVLMVRDVGSGKPAELVQVSLTRGLFCERLSLFLGFGHRKSEAFLVGMFSLLDAILERPMFDILYKMPLSEDVKSALMGADTLFHMPLVLIRSFERGNWAEVNRIADHYHLETDMLNKLYWGAAGDAERAYGGSVSF